MQQSQRREGEVSKTPRREGSEGEREDYTKGVLKNGLNEGRYVGTP